jgi:hypothetical protein
MVKIAVSEGAALSSRTSIPAPDSDPRILHDHGRHQTKAQRGANEPIHRDIWLQERRLRHRVDIEDVARIEQQRANWETNVWGRHCRLMPTAHAEYAHVHSTSDALQAFLLPRASLLTRGHVLCVPPAELENAVPHARLRTLNIAALLKHHEGGYVGDGDEFSVLGGDWKRGS